MSDAQERGTREQPYDLILIGGGINGAGMARDAAKRGLSVALFEQRDFSTGATWASSGMIHGGLRYLSRDPEVTRLACLDSGYIQRIAPHLIFRIPFIAPWLREGGLKARVIFELAEIYFDTYDRYQPLKRGLRHSRMTPEETLSLEPGIRPDILGSLSMDEWGMDSQRLNVINALDARLHGADLHTYHRVEGLLRADRATVCGVRVHDRVSGTRREVFGRVVFNAAGPWAMAVAEREGVRSVKVRPGKGVHLVYAGRLTNYAVLSTAVDGRQIFICPHQNHTLVGTTDDDYYGDMEHIPVLEDEVEYLLQGVEHIFPSIRKYPIIGTTVGCRATLHAYGRPEDDLSREHRVFDHAEDGCRGFFSMAGGKLASYRIMAEEAVDAVMAFLGRSAACRTHLDALPGGAQHDLTEDAFTELGVSAVAARRILYRHGSNAERIRALMQEAPETRAVVDAAEPVTEAELRYVFREEACRTLDDAKRRTRLGVGADGGARPVLRAAQIFCEEMALPPDALGEVALDFLQCRWEDRRGILRGHAKAMEEQAQAMAFLAAGLGEWVPGRGAEAGR
ncbi:MAG: glycerol-3-phosphate dehydrogenase/oxidase [Deltaproteobacteria bacterium]|nr:MAG: glycerol-3-phosphate dehydrogenase/oxidase [Deltaproteobacteria bacterium]